MSASKTYTGHDLHVLPGTEYAHCRGCDGSGAPRKPNSFTSECPGDAISSDNLIKIYDNRLDYRKGKWVARHATS